MLKIGIIGLPNVGKSLLFNKLTKNNILSKNYFFSTIKENINFLKIYNKELLLLKKIINPKKINNKNIIIIDFAGLIKKASKGKGLGLNILNKIQKLDLIIHVIKIFNNNNIYNYYDNNIYNNINIIKNELILKDIITIKNILNKNKKYNNIYIKYMNILNKNIFLNKFYNIKNFFLKNLITIKPIIYLFNINKNKNKNIKKILFKINYDIKTPNIGVFFLDIKKNKYNKLINYIYNFLNLKYCFTIKNKIISL
ncbi:MAG: GTPase [Candidatus Shikimatogenerans sp. Tder]|uniref:GTPase n=1 Tax=Candidatus Shikimatogenerans sp. Tder TaxID=3158566 RepID=A0AAU7QU76_9FLAO